MVPTLNHVTAHFYTVRSMTRHLLGCSVECVAARWGRHRLHREGQIPLNSSDAPTMWMLLLSSLSPCYYCYFRLFLLFSYIS
jgi:hypothetical protein